jgi:hypothetical protein
VRRLSPETISLAPFDPTHKTKGAADQAQTCQKEGPRFPARDRLPEVSLNRGRSSPGRMAVFDVTIDRKAQAYFSCYLAAATTQSSPKLLGFPSFCWRCTDISFQRRGRVLPRCRLRE